MNGKLNKWNSWGMTVTGSSHIKMNIPNQDAWLSKHFSWGDVIVVADGLGSHQDSDIGAKAICRAVVSIAKIYSYFQYINIERLLKRIHSKWLEELKETLPSKSSSTVLFVIRYKKETIISQLGDGLIMGFSENENSFIIQEDKKESFSNMTHGLRKNFNLKYWKIERFKTINFKTFILCTDGISDDLVINRELEFGKELYKSNKKYSKKRVEKSLKKMLMNWPVPNHSDDKTIACLYRGK